ncbi:hypothetical protein KW786_03430 [Candidatus Parcubacteria bacterium]|nr:hypothetical protein [Candidatus Parcubacteria bacterium]
MGKPVFSASEQALVDQVSPALAGFEARIAGLSSRQKRVLRLRVLAGESLEAIGQRIGFTSERVRKIINKALSRLPSR